METQQPKFHFIAIGGAVMHNLALELQAHGYNITGSDDEIFDPAKSRLQAAGLLPETLGWFPHKIDAGLEGVILGMHARADNPELIKAQQLGVPIYSFPEFIYHHSKNKKRVVVGGSHGKTTSTAMLMHVLRECNMDFDYLVGSQLSGFDRMVKLSHAPLIVIEGDEYLTSALNPVPKFHWYKPHLSMITGIAWDHINVFPTFENYVEQFRVFIKTIEKQGVCFWYEADEHLTNLFAESEVRNQSYHEPEFSITLTGTSVNVAGQTYNLSIFGRHNLQNAAGVAKLAGELGISENRFWEAMQTFSGTAKRLEKLHDSETLTVFRDFAHAPSKVKATVQAVREQYPDANFLAILELHTFSSLQPSFLPNYKGTMDMANQAIVYTDPHVFELKKMPVPEPGFIAELIENIDETFNIELLKKAVKTNLNLSKKNVILFMSSGGFSGLNFDELRHFIAKK